jgi:hypothetical protein
VFAALLSGCQSFVDYVTADMKPIPEDERKTTFECRDVSPPQLDNEIIRCREV